MTRNCLFMRNENIHDPFGLLSFKSEERKYPAFMREVTLRYCLRRFLLMRYVSCSGEISILEILSIFFLKIGIVGGIRFFD